MKIKIISCHEEIELLEPNEKYIHVAFRPSMKDFFTIVDHCPRLEFIQLPRSYGKTLAKSMRLFFSSQGIRIIEGTVWGHRKDLYEYFETAEKADEQISEMLEQNIPLRDITEAISKRYKISSELANYMILATEQ